MASTDEWRGASAITSQLTAIVVTLAWVPACRAFRTIACRDAGMTLARVARKRTTKKRRARIETASGRCCCFRLARGPFRIPPMRTRIVRGKPTSPAERFSWRFPQPRRSGTGGRLDAGELPVPIKRVPNKKALQRNIVNKHAYRLIPAVYANTRLFFPLTEMRAYSSHLAASTKVEAR